MFMDKAPRLAVPEPIGSSEKKIHVFCLRAELKKVRMLVRNSFGLVFRCAAINRIAVTFIFGEKFTIFFEFGRTKMRKRILMLLGHDHEVLMNVETVPDIISEDIFHDPEMLGFAFDLAVTRIKRTKITYARFCLAPMLFVGFFDAAATCTH